MSMMSELKRRSVFKVGAAYLVVGWLVVQAASILFPLFEAPAWALRVFVLVIFLGFPVALVLAWVFDVTPEGVKVDAGREGSWKFYAVAGVVMALALGWYFYGQPATRAVAPDQRSIAVLPFVNMSGDAENEYFSDGISEEILNQLAKMPELRVAARTSSFSFKGGKLEIPDIARELQVRLVLEGSVRKQGNTVRITAQLIDAEGGFHLWSETYDRDLKDIFAVQDEIARAIAKQLQLTARASMSRPTICTCVRSRFCRVATTARWPRRWTCSSARWRERRASPAPRRHWRSPTRSTPNTRRTPRCSSASSAPRRICCRFSTPWSAYLVCSRS